MARLTDGYLSAGDFLRRVIVFPIRPARILPGTMSETVRQMFSEISGRYDVGNDILSFGIHRLWKQRMVESARAPNGGSVLDLATGTGDIAILFADAVGPAGTVVGSDFCADMIAIAERRPKNLRPNLRFEVGDAMDLQYDDNSFDVCSISFGIRNVDNPETALREMRRVVRPGGRVVVLEFGQPSGLFGSIYRIYSNTVLPLAGGVVSGNFKAYDYLNRTAATFPCGDAFVAIMQRAGFVEISAEPLFGGVAWLYIGEVGLLGSVAQQKGADASRANGRVEAGR